MATTEQEQRRPYKHPEPHTDASIRHWCRPCLGGVCDGEPRDTDAPCRRHERTPWVVQRYIRYCAAVHTAPREGAIVIDVEVWLVPTEGSPRNLSAARMAVQAFLLGVEVTNGGDAWVVEDVG